MRCIGVDPGEKRIGLAVSDENATIARPLQILARISYQEDASRILSIAVDLNAELIVIGQSIDEDGNPTYMGRQSARLADAIIGQMDVPIILWDEAFTTRDAQEVRLRMGLKQKDRRKQIDDEAAAGLLQSYLDTMNR